MEFSASVYGPVAASCQNSSDFIKAKNFLISWTFIGSSKGLRFDELRYYSSGP
jgi:hypothetical protein